MLEQTNTILSMLGCENACFWVFNFLCVRIHLKHEIIILNYYWRPSTFLDKNMMSGSEWACFYMYICMFVCLCACAVSSHQTMMIGVLKLPSNHSALKGRGGQLPVQPYTRAHYISTLPNTHSDAFWLPPATHTKACLSCHRALYIRH